MTDTNQVSELYELCKEVYRRTKWDEKKDYLFIEDSFHASRPEWDEIEVAHHDMSAKRSPLYTSDYLLEKGVAHSLTHWVIGKGDEWRALGHTPRKKYEVLGDTPLLALLKLTIALSEAGELK